MSHGRGGWTNHKEHVACTDMVGVTPFASDTLLAHGTPLAHGGTCIPCPCPCSTAPHRVGAPPPPPPARCHSAQPPPPAHHRVRSTVQQHMQACRTHTTAGGERRAGGVEGERQQGVHTHTHTHTHGALAHTRGWCTQQVRGETQPVWTRVQGRWGRRDPQNPVSNPPPPSLFSHLHATAHGHARRGRCVGTHVQVGTLQGSEGGGENGQCWRKPWR